MGIWYKFCRMCLRMHMTVTYFGRVYNRKYVPDDGPVILVSNHQSFLDPVIVGYGLDREVNYMARDSLFRNPVFGWFIRSVNAFPIRRGEADMRAIKETFRRLKDGKVVLMFPEATRTSNGKITPFKPGLALLAQKAQAAVVPVVIDGAFEAWPRTSPIPKPFSPVSVSFGKPFLPAEFQNYDPEEFSNIIYVRLLEMQKELRTHNNRTPYIYDEERED